ncbi:MAG: hypothetical protein ACREDM_10870 [Methylocella sp.]
MESPSRPAGHRPGGSGRVSVIHAAGKTVVATVTVGAYPFGIGIMP